ncbi:acetylxylan esterase [Bacillus sp. FJAT-27225]|uniref:acetylxylan esterase n=1 Tax=Bacillus sp. FJAT-27225 TaxID=1743144 RepID=UPI000980E5DC
MERISKLFASFNKKEAFDCFWKKSLKEAAEIPLNSVLKEVDYPIKQIRAYDVSYQGFGGNPINGYYILPKETSSSVPCIICYHGYGSDKGSISNYMKWVIQGYAVLAVDTRGHGDSGDVSGYMTGTNGTWV